MSKCIKCHSHDIIESEKGIYCCNCGWDSEKEKYAKKQTNSDRIRSFSDEELAEFIEQISTDSMETISFGTKEYEEIWEHKETALKWLQSEVEE